MPELPITGGFYESDSLPISAQQCKNFRVNFPQTEGALSAGNLFGTEGQRQIVTTGDSNNANRGGHEKETLPYFVNGEFSYRIDRAVDAQGVESYTIVNTGSIPGTNRVSFADNGKQMILIVDGEGWIIDESVSPTAVPITDAGFKANGVPQQVDFIDTYFVVTTDEKKFIRCDSNNGLSWNSLNVYTAEADPDGIVAPIVFKGQLFIGGSQVTEVFNNDSGVFRRVGNLIINKGISAPFAVAKTSDTFMWLGAGVNESPAIWAYAGNSAQKISTTAIDSVIDKFSPEDILLTFAYSYAQAGAYIVGFTFPGRTFEYNTITQRWNERSSRIETARGAVVEQRWRVNSIVSAYNKILCGDAIDGRIGEMGLEFFDEYGGEILRTLTTQPFANQGQPITVSMMEITMESGVGGFVDDPQIRLSTSRDGGKSFNNELSRGFGKVGENNRRAIWRQLGDFSRYAVFKFEMSDPVKPVIIKLEADFV